MKNLRKKVFVYAHQLRRHNDLTLSEALIEAWDFIKSNQDVQLLTFKKVRTDELCKRIVATDWSKYYEVKGTGRPLKPGQVLFADLAKVASGKRAIISTYEDRIVELAA